MNLVRVLITALILALCACGGDGDTGNTAPDGAADCGAWDHGGCTQPDLSGLPGIILEDHREWVDLYRVAWEIARAKIQTGTPENGFVEAYMDEGFSKNIYQWDTIFMTLFGRYSNGEFPSIVSLENFYRKQHDNGYICREIRESDGTDFIYRTLNDTVNPPLFAWAEWQHYLVTGDPSRFTKRVNGKTVLERLVDHFHWIRDNRRRDNGLYWTTGLASGADNTPNVGHVWVDLSVQQALNAFTIARIADVVGDTETRDLFEAEYGQLSELINELLWDDTEGFYHNLTEDGSFLRCKTPAGFWPMVASLADDYRSGRLVEHIINPSEFWRSHVIPSLSADHPQYSPLGFYWRGSVWAPWLYHTIKGLEARGFGSLAHEASINHVENLVQVLKWTGTIWENYSPDWPIPGIPAKPDFVGWSGLGPIALLIENILGIRARAPSDSILWDIRLTERHGISNLRFCSNTVSLTCERRETAMSPAEITAVTDNPFSLTVNIGPSSFTHPIPPGTTVIYTDPQGARSLPQ